MGQRDKETKRDILSDREEKEIEKWRKMKMICGTVLDMAEDGLGDDRIGRPCQKNMLRRDIKPGHGRQKLLLNLLAA